MIKNKNIIITGASAGLGASLAWEIAKRGGFMTLCARRLDALEDLKKAILAQYPNVEIITIKTDVTDKKSVAQAVEQSVSRFGALDIFIANAGQGMWSRFCDMEDPDCLKEMMDLNYMGVVYSAFYSLPHLRSSHGSFVAISSVQGAMPVPYHTGYVASKYAVNGFIETLSIEEPEVHFLLALPSWISGTELRSHALVGTKKESIEVKKNHGKSAMTGEECAKRVLDALEAQKSYISMPRAFGLVPILRTLFRKTVDKIIKKKVDQQLN